MEKKIIPKPFPSDFSEGGISDSTVTTTIKKLTTTPPPLKEKLFTANKKTGLIKTLNPPEKELQQTQNPIPKKIKPPSLENSLKKNKKKKNKKYVPSLTSSSSYDEDPFRNDDDYDKNTFSTFDDENSTLDTDHAKETNIFNSKKERNKFLSKIISKSKKKIYKMAGCFLTPFLLFKLIVPDLPIF